VIVAVVVVGVMTVTLDDVVDVVIVLDRGMTARGAMDVAGVVTFANVGNAGCGAHVLSYARWRQRIP
jgi:hypothetical protein